MVYDVGFFSARVLHSKQRRWHIKFSTQIQSPKGFYIHCLVHASLRKCSEWIQKIQHSAKFLKCRRCLEICITSALSYSINFMDFYQLWRQHFSTQKNLEFFIISIVPYSISSEQHLEIYQLWRFLKCGNSARQFEQHWFCYGWAEYCVDIVFHLIQDFYSFRFHWLQMELQFLWMFLSVLYYVRFHLVILNIKHLYLVHLYPALPPINPEQCLSSIFPHNNLWGRFTEREGVTRWKSASKCHGKVRIWTPASNTPTAINSYFMFHLFEDTSWKYMK